MSLSSQERRAVEERLSKPQTEHIAGIWLDFGAGAIDGATAQARIEAYLEKIYRATFGAKPRKQQSARLAPSQYYARANQALYADKALTPSARRLVLQLVQLARGRGCVTAFVGQLADALAVTERTIQNAQVRAQERGFITIERVRIGRENEANVYTLQDLALLPKPKRAAKSARVGARSARATSSRDSVKRRSRDSSGDDAALAVDDSFLNHSRDSRVFVGEGGENFFTPQGRYNSPSGNISIPTPLPPSRSVQSDDESGAPLVAARGHSPAPQADSGALSEAAGCQAEREANFAPEPSDSACAEKPPP